MRPLPALLLLLAVALPACKAAPCDLMMQCCQRVKGMDGLGSSCGPLAEGAADPNTCRSVTMTVRLMLEKRGQPVPAACQDAP